MIYGVMVRLARIEQQGDELSAHLERIDHELHPNSVASLRDAVDRVDVRTQRLAANSPDGRPRPVARSSGGGTFPRADWHSSGVGHGRTPIRADTVAATGPRW